MAVENDFQAIREGWDLVVVGADATGRAVVRDIMGIVAREHWWCFVLAGMPFLGVKLDALRKLIGWFAVERGCEWDATAQCVVLRRSRPSRLAA
jgi:hypothetical protein